MLLLARAVDDRTALNETNARKLYGPFLRPMSHVLGSQPMTEFGPGACTLATLGASNVTGRQSTTDGLLSSDLIRRIRHQPPTGRGELTDDPIAATLHGHVLQIYRSAPRLYLAGLRSLLLATRHVSTMIVHETSLIGIARPPSLWEGRVFRPMDFFTSVDSSRIANERKGRKEERRKIVEFLFFFQIEIYVRKLSHSGWREISYD